MRVVAEQTQLARMVVFLLPRVDSIYFLGVVCVEDHPNMSVLVAIVAVPTVPVVKQVIDLQWLQDVIRKHFAGQCSGLDLYSVLDFLKCRLTGLINDQYFEQLPEFRRVSVLWQKIRAYQFRVKHTINNKKTTIR